MYVVIVDCKRKNTSASEIYAYMLVSIEKLLPSECFLVRLSCGVASLGI